MKKIFTPIAALVVISSISNIVSAQRETSATVTETAVVRNLLFL